MLAFPKYADAYHLLDVPTVPVPAVFVASPEFVTVPSAVKFPVPPTVNAATELFAPPSYTMNPPVPEPLVLFTTTAFAPAPAFRIVLPF